MVIAYAICEFSTMTAMAWNKSVLRIKYDDTADETQEGQKKTILLCFPFNTLLTGNFCLRQYNFYLI